MIPGAALDCHRLAPPPQAATSSAQPVDLQAQHATHSDPPFSQHPKTSLSLCLSCRTSGLFSVLSSCLFFFLGDRQAQPTSPQNPQLRLQVAVRRSPLAEQGPRVCWSVSRLVWSGSGLSPSCPLPSACLPPQLSPCLCSHALPNHKLCAPFFQLLSHTLSSSLSTACLF